MKALSLTQPWATAVVTGVKQIETRSWTTSYRGQIAIHAAKGFPKSARAFAETEFRLRRLPGNLPLGAIIGLATIQRVQKTEEVVSVISVIERLYGDYSFGRYAWILCDITKLADPVACRGALGLWNVPTEVEAQINSLYSNLRKE